MAIFQEAELARESGATPYQPPPPGPVAENKPTYPDTVPDSPEGYPDGPVPDPGVDGAGTTIQDLYGEGVGDSTPTAGGVDTPTVEDPTGADVTEVDSTGYVGTPGTGYADPNAGVQAGVDAVSGVGSGETTDLTSEQQVDAELTRILGKDSPLLAQARAQAAQQANARGLQNSSMAAGMSQDAMVKAALPMAQQNAAQAAARELANTANLQQAGQFSAQETARLRALEAELGTSVSVFNAEQLNQAESLAAQMRTAIAQQDANAYNQASQQLADLQRSAEAQQADIDMAGAQQTAAERQAYNQQTIDRVSQLNLQYLQGEQAMDLADIQGQYQQIISQNTTAASLYNSYLTGMAGIMDNPDMTSQQVASAVKTMQSMLEASLRMMTELNGLDIGNVGGSPTGGSTGGGSTGGGGGTGGGGTGGGGTNPGPGPEDR
jgi:hypothetical protein